MRALHARDLPLPDRQDVTGRCAGRPRITSRRLAVWTLAIFLGSLLLVFGRSMHADMDVDEPPFIASGALLARRGLLPYRDYHYNHMPTEVMVYAVLFRASPYLLMSARCFQVLCAASAAAVLFYVAFVSLDTLGLRARLAFGAGAAALLLSHPLFIKTAGLCWNHDFPLLMALLAFLALRRGLRGPRPLPGAAISGLLLGLSVTTRLTYATTGLGFLLLIALYPGLSLRRKTAILLAVGAGFLVASGPSLWVWAQSPRNAFFGNFLYPRLNTEIHALRDKHKRFTILPIFGYFLRNLIYLPGNGLLTVGLFGLAALAFVRRAQIGRQRTVVLIALLVLVIGLTGSAFMPAPPYPQYFYAAAPFMILGLVWCVAAMPELLHRGWPWMAAGLGVSVAFAAPFYTGVAFVAMPTRWVPLQIHQVGLEVAQKAGTTRVLTLESVYPLEGGLAVDERLTTGRFGLRVASLLSPAERAQYLMPTPEDLPSILRRDRPAVLVVHVTDWRIDGERGELVRAAEALGYQKAPLTHRGAIWRPPRR